jgi:DNA-binding NarL/FixJ family response regulator
VRAVLWRAEADATALVRAVRAVPLGRASPPANVQGRLSGQREHVRREVFGPREPVVSGLSRREIEVLRLASKGMTLPEITSELGYSERTVKNILSAVQIRLGTRDRVHAVTHAIRTSLI